MSQGHLTSANTACWQLGNHTREDFHFPFTALSPCYSWLEIEYLGPQCFWFHLKNSEAILEEVSLCAWTLVLASPIQTGKTYNQKLLHCVKQKNKYTFLSVHLTSSQVRTSHGEVLHPTSSSLQRHCLQDDSLQGWASRVCFRLAPRYARQLAHLLCEK